MLNNYIQDILPKDFVCKYERILYVLDSTPFIWSIERDANRANMGLELKDDWFTSLSSIKEREDVYLSGFSLTVASVFDVIYSLARSIDEILYDPNGNNTLKYLEELILNLYKSYDMDIFDADITDDSLQIPIFRFIDREYKYNGVGGLFPLDNPVDDQRDVELWYQMQAYISTIQEGISPFYPNDY